MQSIMQFIKRMIPIRTRKKIQRLIIKFKTNFILPFRMLNWEKRSLPEFIIIGAQKSGTSSLYAYLSQHPQIQSGFLKEVHFFDGGLNPRVDTFKKGERWYRSHFPLNNKLQGGKKTFEATPEYLFNPLVPERIAQLLPGVKLIVCLRNPTERAISHYFHERKKRMDLEKLPILKALKAEEQRLEECIANKNYKSEAFIHYSYKSRGLYKEQISRYYEYFDKEDILIIDSEELFNETKRVLKDVFRFVGVNPDIEIDDIRVRGRGSNKKKVAQIVYDYLDDYFQPHHQPLFEMLGREFDW